MKPLRFLGSSKKDYDELPRLAQYSLGNELRLVQSGERPSDCKPMPSIGPGVEEIRVWAESGTFRVIYIARRPEAVYVLHAFQKKSQQTSQSDLKLARKRLCELL
jgi:phage-related protein